MFGAIKSGARKVLRYFKKAPQPDTHKGRTEIVFGYAGEIWKGAGYGHLILTAIENIFGYVQGTGAALRFALPAGLHAALSAIQRPLKSSKNHIAHAIGIGAEHIQDAIKGLPFFVNFFRGVIGVTDPAALKAMFGVGAFFSVTQHLLNKFFTEERLHALKNAHSSCKTYTLKFLRILKDYLFPILKRAGQGALGREVLQFAINEEFPAFYIFIALPAVIELTLKLIAENEKLKETDGYIATHSSFDTAMEGCETAAFSAFFLGQFESLCQFGTESQIEASIVGGLIGLVVLGQQLVKKYRHYSAEHPEPQEDVSVDTAAMNDELEQLIIDIHKLDPDVMPGQASDAELPAEASAYTKVTASLPVQSVPINAPVQPVSGTSVGVASSPAVLEQPGDIELDVVDSSDPDLEAGDAETLITRVTRSYS